MDRSICDQTRVQIIGLYPSIQELCGDIRFKGELIDSQNPHQSYSSSPFAVLHVGLQGVRRALLTEIFERAEFARDLPLEIANQVNPAWQEFQALPPPRAPQLDHETIANLARIPSTVDKLTWELIADGLLNGNALVKRTLAAKFKFQQTFGFGYNRTASLMAGNMLTLLDTVSQCTPWQLEINKDGYQRSIRQAAYAFTSRGRFRNYLRPGGMWSDEMLDDPEIEDWLGALETGFPPS